MYESTPRQREGEPIEEVLNAAMEATATSGREQKGRWALSASVPRRRTAPKTPAPTEEPRMRVMKAGSPTLRLPEGFSALALAALALVLAVVLALIVLLVAAL